MVVRVLWSTKYGRPSGVCRCSQPEGSSPVPAVVAPVAIMLAALAAPAVAFGGEGCRSARVGELAPVRSSGNIRFWWRTRSCWVDAATALRLSLSLKPAPGLIRRAAAELGVDPAECVVIGDIGADVQAARAAGARAILVPTPTTRQEEVADADEVAPDLVTAVERALGSAA